MQYWLETHFGVFPLTQKNLGATPLVFLVGIFKFGILLYCYKYLEISIFFPLTQKNHIKENLTQPAWFWVVKKINLPIDQPKSSYIGLMGLYISLHLPWNELNAGQLGKTQVPWTKGLELLVTLNKPTKFICQVINIPYVDPLEKL